MNTSVMERFGGYDMWMLAALLGLIVGAIIMFMLLMNSKPRLPW